MKINFDGGNLSSDAGLLLVKDTFIQFDDIDKSFRDIIYAIKRPEHVLLDLDSTLLSTYGKQEGKGFDFYYQVHGKKY